MELDDDYGVDLRLDMWPSVTEIHEASLDLYMGAMAPFYQSLQNVVDSIKHKGRKDINIRSASYPLKLFSSYFGTADIAQSEPEVIAGLVLAVKSTAGATALYKLLKLWVDLKNGRRIRAKFGSPAEDFEVDVTQMSKQQFLQFFERVKGLHRQASPVQDIDDVIRVIAEFRERLRADGIMLRSTDSGEQKQELLTVLSAAHAALSKARGE